MILYPRLWESSQYTVVLGHSSKMTEDVNLEACREAGVRILRRRSGGGAVLLGPGCLNYSLTLSLDEYPEFHDVRRSFCAILSSLRDALDLECLAIRGLSDLAVGDRKVSGNAQRRSGNSLLHHGTLLYNFDAAQAERFLRQPSRQPDYRRGRSHRDFLGNLPLSASEIKERIAHLRICGL